MSTGLYEGLRLRWKYPVHFHHCIQRVERTPWLCGHLATVQYLTCVCVCVCVF